ncbi:triglyceride lipase NDAI_0C00700 [Naumovozyma dairenensis CBS 421]|uniref:GPI inositol-deacylase n=1 Tax=Naumovozyma dairenensis (strain ATCC 10597 / BCRC 20456 / CBS 421 / NBRC 0211 / NRRL Y-12639) TaxID=1071378 RepID=G0W7H0_NAUDC|nr:hypothetical protein NDAI_0C00700 [Naumovozyma dairenensis CBS 421]CCD23731.1 hypothetical protein NDAI_0C00700 [Naumovozyma dairenensis CBS 421]
MFSETFNTLFSGIFQKNIIPINPYHIYINNDQKKHRSNTDTIRRKEEQTDILTFTNLIEINTTTHAEEEEEEEAGKNVIIDFVTSYRDFLKLKKSKERKVEDIILNNFEPNPDYKPPKYPVVLCHGLSGFDRLVLIPSIYSLTKLIMNSINSDKSDNFLIDDRDDDSDGKTTVGNVSERAKDDKKIAHRLGEVEYWIGIKEILEEKGCSVLTTRVPSFGSIEERALALHEFLESEIKRKLNSKGKDNSNGKVKLNLIAHSMGGLDCRYLISKIPKKNYQVVSLTTISTPHHGSEMADYVVNLFEKLKTVPSFGTNDSTTSSTQILPLCFYQLTTDYMKYFNFITPDDPKVAYFSYGCYFQPKWYNVFAMSWKIVYDASNGARNDGMVTVDSSKWGQYQGTLANIDHLDIINWKNKVKLDLGKMILNLKNENLKKMVEPDIDILEFYVNITDNLAKKGF